MIAIRMLVVLMSSLVAMASDAQSVGAATHERRVVTLTNGLYPEFFGNDTLRKVGRVWFNSVSGKIASIEGAEVGSPLLRKGNDDEVGNTAGTISDFRANMRGLGREDGSV